MSSRVVVLVALCAALGSGCATVMTPTHPSMPLSADGEALKDLRFDGEQVQLREPTMPVAPSGLWQKEVQNFAASGLNRLLSTPEDAPIARTIVTFDLASPPAFQVGPWKHIVISVASTLPDGTVVKSAPVTGEIDDAVEVLGLASLGVCGTGLDVLMGVGFLVSFVTGSPILFVAAIGALVAGLALHVLHQPAQLVVAGSEERRWSDLFATALALHAGDIRACRTNPTGPRCSRAVPVTLPPGAPPPAMQSTPADPTALPPPPVLDPAG